MGVGFGKVEVSEPQSQEHSFGQQFILGRGLGLPWFIARAPGMGLWRQSDCWGVKAKTRPYCQNHDQVPALLSQTLGSLVSKESPG